MWLLLWALHMLISLFLGIQGKKKYSGHRYFGCSINKTQVSFFFSSCPCPEPCFPWQATLSQGTLVAKHKKEEEGKGEGAV